MHNDILIELTLLLVLGVLAQWVASRLKIPSILLLLITGIFAGPILGLIHVDKTLGDGLFPVVSLSVAIILFEGGLSLHLDDIKGSRQIVQNLVTISVLITWAISGVAAYFLLDLDIAISALLGATLVVTGPTVIIPMLQQIRPAGRVSSILRWEGIVIDPVGAVLALLVFEEILISDLQEGVVAAIIIFVRTVIIGVVLGWFSANAMIELYSRERVQHSLQIPITLMFVLAAFTVSNVLQAESGLLTVTIMGIVMANQRKIDVHHIAEFKEYLQVLLLSTLFIMLSARLRIEDLERMNPNIILFILVLIFIARPLSVMISTYGSTLTWREKLFLSWMAPRGIVAAAVASIFALELAENGGHPGAELLVPYTFTVIITTVAVYSLTAGRVALWLGLSEKFPQGLLIVGASPWIRQLAKVIQDAGFRVVLSDTNFSNVEHARREGLTVYHGSILSDNAIEEINLGGIGRLLALTPNDEVNALACEQFKNTFGEENVYQLHYYESKDETNAIASRLGGRFLFKPESNHITISSDYLNGVRAVHQTLKGQQNAIELTETIQPLFLIEKDQLNILSSAAKIDWENSDTMIGLSFDSEETSGVE